MPFSDPEVRAAYFRRRYAERRTAAMEILGGRCKNCGTTEDLEIDHRDPAAKSMDFSAMAMASRERFLAELRKCQALCSPCHTLKSRVGGAKLADAQVAEMRRLHSSGCKGSDLARRFGVTRGYASRVLRGRRRAIR